METKSKVDGTLLSKVLVELRAFARGAAQAIKAAASASTHLVQAAIAGGNAFDSAVEAFYGEVRANTGGIAKAIGAERNKEDSAYVIPGSLRAQVSQVQRALKYGVDLGTAQKPRTITDIRKDTQKAAEAAEAAEAAKNAPPLTASDILRNALLAALADAQTAIKGSDGDTLAKLDTLTREYVTEVLAVLAAGAAQAAPTADAKVPAAGGMLPNGKAAGRGRKAAEAISKAA